MINEDFSYDISAVLNLSNVVEVHKLNYNLLNISSPTFKNNFYDGRVGLVYGNEKVLPEKIIGRKFTNEETGVAICPKYFVPSGISEGTDHYLDGEQLIGSSFIGEVNTYEKINDEVVKGDKYSQTYKIVGVYYSSLGDGLNTCYITGTDMIKLQSMTLDVINPKTINSMLVTVDSYDNVDKVVREIHDLGFMAETQVVMDNKIVDSIHYIAIFLTIIIVFTTFLVVSSYIKKKNVDTYQELRVLKALGFRDKEIIKKNILEVLILSTFYCLISLGVFLLTIMGLKLYFKSFCWFII